MINNIVNLIDKYTNLIYTYINKIKVALIVNKFIYINNKYASLSKEKNEILNLFNRLLQKTIKYLNIQKIINIIVQRIIYIGTIAGDKLILNISNSYKIVMYIPYIHKIRMDFLEKGSYIRLSSTNINYITNLAMLIKNAKKIDIATRIGMYYDYETIKFKKRLNEEFKKNK